MVFFEEDLELEVVKAEVYVGKTCSSQICSRKSLPQSVDLAIDLCRLRYQLSARL